VYLEIELNCRRWTLDRDEEEETSKTRTLGPSFPATAVSAVFYNVCVAGWEINLKCALA